MKKFLIATLLMMALPTLATYNSVSNFGSNPGALKMFTYTPANITGKAPMLVLMHGCQQSAKTFAKETGWQKLADQLGVLLVLPEQTSANNGMNCFTWFEKGDVTRDRGEVASIASMMDYMESNYSVDTKKVFVAGLSAGATMSSALMASYPERFNAGALVSGVSYGCAFQLFQSFTCMFAPSNLPSQTRGDFVREASGNFKGQFPRVMVFHGSADPFVRPANADHSVAQWTNVHGLDADADNQRPAKSGQTIDEHRNANSVLVEQLTVQGAGHGWPVAASKGCGSTSQFVIETGVCASAEMARSWGLLQ